MRTKEDVAKYQKKYREDHKVELAIAKAAWLADHPGYQKKWHADHPGKRAEYRQDWVEKNSLLTNCSRKAAWANGKYPGRITGPEVLAIIERETRCHWCEKELELSERTLEHLRPTNDPQFLTVAGYSCNSRKLQKEHVSREVQLARNREYMRRLRMTPEYCAKKQVAMRVWREEQKIK